MEKAIQTSSTLSGKINVVNDLINMKVHAPSNVDFSPEVSKSLSLFVVKWYNSSYWLLLANQEKLLVIAS